MNVIIGVDPHKATHHAVAVDDDEDELAQVSVRAVEPRRQRLMSWAEPFDRRGRGRSKAPTGSAICCLSSSSRPVNASSMCRRRWLRGRVCSARAGRTRTTRTTPERSRRPRCGTTILREVRPVGHGEVLRLLAKRNTDIGDQRTRLVSHAFAAGRACARAGSPRKSTLPTSTRSSRGCHRRHRSSRSATTSPSSCSTTSAASTRS